MTKKNKTRHRLNELLVELFNYILYIEEKNLKDQGVPLTMSEVHLLESVSKAKNNNVTSIASKMMITKGTFSINASRLEAKGYLRKYRDENDARVVRMEITDKAKEVLKIHDKFHEVLIDRAIDDLDLQDNEILNQSLESILKYLRSEYKVISKDMN